MNTQPLSTAHRTPSGAVAAAKKASAWGRCIAVALLASVTGLALAATGPMDFLYTSGNPPRADNRGPHPRVWKVGEFSAVRLVSAEPGSAPAGQPLVLAAARWSALLATVELLGEDDRRTPLFSADELASLAPVLATAMAVAGPGDDLLLLSTARRGNLLSTPLSVTARLFVQDGQLNLIVHDSRRDAYSEFRVARLVPAFEFGSRSAPSSVRLQVDPPVQLRRSDWVSWSLAGGGDSLPARAQPAVSARSPSPDPAAMAAPAGAVEPAASASGRARGAAFYAEQEERLRGLQRLRDAGLLSEEEFQRKRRAILDSL